MSDLAYAAHTRVATFYLDGEGVCQRVDARDGSASAELTRCIGAQYVASLDVREPGALVAQPRIGAPLLFVVADAHMRYSLVRTAPVERFDTLTEPKTIPAPAPEEVTEDDLLPEITVTWPSTNVLARGIPLPALMRAPLLTPPPRPVRHHA